MSDNESENIVDLSQVADATFKKIKKMGETVYVKEEHIVINVSYEYNIALSRCDSHEKILGWVIHLCEKKWMTSDVMRAFVHTAISAHSLERPAAP